nr:MAG TPA: hypothetical protein [Caudoviricetes sp.]
MWIGEIHHYYSICNHKNQDGKGRKSPETAGFAVLVWSITKTTVGR